MCSLQRRYPELHRLAAWLRGRTLAAGLPGWAAGAALAAVHWWIAPAALAYSLLVPTCPATIAVAFTCCILIAVFQAFYDGRCPLILVERALLDCPSWWRGMPFNLVAAYLQPAIVFGGSAVGLVRFIANVLLDPAE